VLLILTFVLAVIFLPWPWDLAVIMIAALGEVAFTVAGIRYTHRRRARVGVETLVGASASVISSLAPDGQVKVNGEIWRAHSHSEAQVGQAVRITGVTGLTLEVEPR
jgi:membrane protein implicated in regulation of membrane protease activity